MIAARGSSDNVARYAQHLFGRFWGMPVALATPSLHTLYDADIDYRDALVIGISQSGASPDVAGVRKAATAQGAVTIAITNEPASLLAESARHVIELRTGPERSVAATKTYTASLGARGGAGRGRPARSRRDARGDGAPARLLAARGDRRRLGAAGRRRPRRRLRHRVRGGAEALRADRRDRRAVVVADFMHGPIAILEPGFPILAIAPSGPTLDGMRELLEAARERGADVTVISDVADLPGRRIHLERGARSGSARSSPSSPPRNSPSAPPSVLGRDVDRPTGLQKVTLTS